MSLSPIAPEIEGDMDELIVSPQVDTSDAVKIEEAKARQLEAQVEITKAKAAVEASNVLGKWEAISLMVIILLIVIAIVLGKMITAGVFN